MRTTPLIRQPRFLAAAYTLIELLIVISLITVLMGIGSYGIKNYSQARGVGAAVPVAQGVFGQARNLALQKGTDVRLLISADAASTQKHLRYMLLAYRDGADKWVARSKGTYLPEGVFFSHTYSRQDHSDVTYGSNVGAHDKIPKKNLLDIYGSEDAADPNANLSGDYYYYQFSPSGMVGFEVPNDLNIADVPANYKVSPAASFVVGSGAKPPGQSPLVTASGGTKNFGGFVVWRSGRTSTFKHPDQMGIPNNVSTF